VYCWKYFLKMNSEVSNLSIDILLVAKMLMLCWIQQEIWADAHETRDSISLISYAGCLGLSPVYSAKIHSKCASQPKIRKRSLKTYIFGVQGRSTSSMLVPPESSSAVLVMIRSKSVSICNRFHARRANNGKITISDGVPLFDALVRGESPHAAAPNYFIRN